VLLFYRVFVNGKPVFLIKILKTGDNFRFTPALKGAENSAVVSF
jgi:hypothetical protein